MDPRALEKALCKGANRDGREERKALLEGGARTRPVLGARL